MNLNGFLRKIGLNYTSSPVQSFFYKLGEQFSTSTISDKQAIELGYLTNSAWYSISKTISEGVSSLPIKLGEVDSQGEINEVFPGNEVHNWLYSPNNEQTLSELWELNTLYYLCNGEFYEWFDSESIGFMDGRLISLPPELITVLTDDQNSILSNVLGYQFQDNGDNRVFTPEEILHVKMPNPSTNGRRLHNGLSPLQAGSNMLNASNNIETAISWYFENRGVSNLIYGSNAQNGMSMTKADADAMESAMAGRIGGAHKMNSSIVTKSPIGGVANLAASSTDMQMIENYNLVLQRLCSLMGLPSILVNDNEQSTFNNVREAKKQAYYEVYIPIAEKFIRSYDRKWLKDWRERTGKNYILYVDEGEITALQDTPMELRKEAREDVKAGIITRNEARQVQNRSVMEEEEMDKATVQSNIIPINQIETNE